MKKYHFIKFKLLLAFLVLLIGCTEEIKLGFPALDDQAPAPPQMKEVVNLHGKAIIYFTAPSEADLLCVEARYTINDQAYTKRASIFTDSLVLDGFSSEQCLVNLVAVDKSLNESSAVSVTINPLESPIDLIYKSMKLYAAFGGIKVVWDNPTETKVIVNISYKDEINNWVDLETVHSNHAADFVNVRGLDTIPKLFGVTVKDRWGNYSELLSAELTPIFEQELSKEDFSEVTKLIGDAEANTLGYNYIRNIWDGNTSNSFFHSIWGNGSETSGRGLCITFDLGHLAKLSRYKVWHRSDNEDYIYGNHNLKTYDIYGATEITSEMRASGSLDLWTKLYEAENYKPSGIGPVTNDDIAYMLKGDEHEFPLDIPAVRYIRIHMIDTWTSQIWTELAEISFWGSIIE